MSLTFGRCSNASSWQQPQQNTSEQQEGSQQDDQVAECQVESVNRDNNSIIHKPQQEDTSSNGNANEAPILRKVGEKTPPGTLKKLSRDRPSSSCKTWCQQYSQTFLAKTIDTPLPDPGPLEEDE